MARMLIGEKQSAVHGLIAENKTHLLTRKLAHYRPFEVEDQRCLEKMLDQRRRTTEPRSLLSEQGEPPGEICVILDGWAARQKILADGSRQILAFHLPGDVCEFNALLDVPADTEICAISQVRSASITGRMLNELTARAPRVGQALWWDASAGQAIQREWLINIVHRGASQRVTHLLCELHSRLKLVGRAHESGFRSPLTQAHLANACGMTVEHTNRSLRKLRQELGIGFEAGTVAFDNLAAAHRFAGFDGRYILLRNAQIPVPWQAAALNRPDQAIPA